MTEILWALIGLLGTIMVAVIFYAVMDARHANQIAAKFEERWAREDS